MKDLYVPLDSKIEIMNKEELAKASDEEVIAAAMQSLGLEEIDNLIQQGISENLTPKQLQTWLNAVNKKQKIEEAREKKKKQQARDKDLEKKYRAIQHCISAGIMSVNQGREQMAMINLQYQNEIEIERNEEVEEVEYDDIKPIRSIKLKD